MEQVHISETDLASNVGAILRRVGAGTEIIVERDARPAL
jgi:hypothetical protein